jgi:hypothetical protein
MKERTTFYGAREISVTDPAGHHVIFAEMGAAPPQQRQVQYGLGDYSPWER